MGGSWYEIDKAFRLFVIASLRQWAIILRNLPRISGPAPFIEGLTSAFGKAAQLLEWCPVCVGTGQQDTPADETREFKCGNCKGSGKAP
jgi:hypothetical protein